MLVSHDRQLLSATVDEFWIVRQGDLQPFDGDLDAYQQWILEHNSQADAPRPNNSGTDTIDRKAQKRLEAQERQRLSALRKPLEKQISALEKGLGPIDARVQELEDLMADERFYDESNREARSEQIAEHGKLSARKAELEEAWLRLQEEIENIR